MKKMVRKLLQSRRPNQNEVIDFVSDKKTLNKAAQGSMQKRIDLIERVKLKKARI